ncbi:GDSL-type esterase/lipase family protein [Rheinheimera sp.]|uniref:GDSL-type esterase/lipase family protein n=1 Tax=Rheinheimera sp. TaxID=1869214 RepID=UPI0040478CE2
MNINHYANLKKYQHANQDMRTTYPQGVSTVFIGDSITALWQQRRPEFFTKNKFIGRGISGQVTHQILLRFRDDVIQLKPKAVVILAGTNDIAQNSGEVSLQTIANNIFSMAESAHYHGASVILCSILPAQDYPWHSGLAPAKKIIALNNLLKQYALAHAFTYVDYLRDPLEFVHSISSLPV